ncbi:MAG: isoprenylcysteine carboxylmethyltransferase family protein [Deltaproteobacteria bacterium]|nr:isoprenylcysteine carboxylmethyltransferase family protein [Deltaproteobacteria bacterium]
MEEQPKEQAPEQAKEYKFTPEQLKSIKKFRLAMVPFRMILALTFFSMIVGGPRRFFSETPGLIFAILFSLLLLVERIFQAPDIGGKRKDQGSALFLWSSFGLAYLLALVDYYWVRPHWFILEWNWIYPIVAVSCYVVGQTLRVTAIRTLGRFFTISVRLHDGHRVVKQGIYSVIRHPAYTGLWLVNLGFISVFASVFSFAAFFLLGLPALVYRIKIEEQMLVDEFGQEYKDYCTKTKRLIPFIY